MKPVFSFLKTVAGIFGYSAEAKLETDIETTVAAPTEGNLDTDVTDLEAVIEHLDSKISQETVEAVGGILISGISLRDDHSVHNIEAFGATIVHTLPKFGLKDSPLDDATKQAILASNSTFDATSLIIVALLKQEGIS